MLFNSYVFILLFLPITLGIYFLLNHIHQFQCAKASLILASLFFYGYNNPSYVIIILSSIFINYGFFLCMNRFPRYKKTLLTVGILFNIFLLGYFKYYDFFIENINQLFQSNFNLLHLMLPLGISFFTFQQLSFLIDSYHGECTCKNFLDYALFVTFFPQLVAGPIVSHDEMIPQFASLDNKKPKYDNICTGLILFSLGMFKKVVIADSFGRIVTYGYGNIPTLNTLETLLTIAGYTIQIYYDFSGYCDMASGIAWMFNIELPINFNSPYKTHTIAQFWKCWHITLTRFLTKYIYIPLGGNRKGAWRTYVNILITFLVSGFWHGAGYTFLLWGLLHGIANILCRAFDQYIRRIPKWITWIFNFGFLNINWVFFRADSISQAFSLLSRIFSYGFMVNDELNNQLTQMLLVDIPYRYIPFRFVVFGYTMLTLAGSVILKNSNEILASTKNRILLLPLSILLFLLSVLSLSGVSTFLYFNF